MAVGVGIAIEIGVVKYEVTAFWDAEAALWLAESDDVPGLITEADTFEALLRRLMVLVPELLELNREELTDEDHHHAVR